MSWSLRKVIIIITVKCFQRNVCINDINMLYYGKIGISDGINNKRIRRKRVLIKEY